MAEAVEPSSRDVALEVFDALSPEERVGLVAMWRLDAAPAVIHWLNERFRMPEDPPDAVGTFVPYRYARVSPRSRREAHVTYGVTFRREAGWHRVSRALARALAREAEVDTDPHSGCIFEITLFRPVGRVVELNV